MEGVNRVQSLQKKLQKVKNCKSSKFVGAEKFSAQLHQKNLI